MDYSTWLGPIWQLSLIAATAAISTVVINRPLLRHVAFSVLRTIEVARMAVFTTLCLGTVGSLRLLRVSLSSDLILAAGLAGVFVTALSILWLRGEPVEPSTERAGEISEPLELREEEAVETEPEENRLREEEGEAHTKGGELRDSEDQEESERLEIAFPNRERPPGPRSDVLEESERVALDLQRRLSRRSTPLRWALSSFLVISVIAAVLYIENNPELVNLIAASRSGQTGETVETAGLGQLIEAADFLYLSREDVECGSLEDVECALFRNKISIIRGDRFLFFWKTIFLFVLFWTIFSYVAEVAELSVATEPDEPEELGLRHDIVEHAGGFIAVTLAGFMALTLAGVDYGGLGVFAGLLGAGISVALKDVIGNMVSGALLLWDRTIRKNDVITISKTAGAETGSSYAVVKRMTLRNTIVEDRNEVTRLIPNSILTGSIVENWTHGGNLVRLAVSVPVGYGSDLHLAREILESVCYEVRRIVKYPKRPVAVISDFGDSAIVFSLRFWIQNAQEGIRPVLSAVRWHAWERLKQEGITIPFPQRDVHLYSGDERSIPLIDVRIQNGDNFDEKDEAIVGGTIKGQEGQPTIPARRPSVLRGGGE